MGTVLTRIRPVGYDIPFPQPVNVRFEGGFLREVSVDPILPAPGDLEIDGGGRFAFPGFIDAHTHLPMVLLRGLADDVPLGTWLKDHIWPREQSLTSDDIYWGTLLACAELIRGGTIGVIDMYFELDRMAQAVAETGIRAILSHGIVAADLDGKGQSELAQAEHSIRTWHGEADGRLKTALAPHAVYTCGERVIRRVVEMAHAFNVSIHTHVSETREEVRAWTEQTGESPVATLERLEVFSRPTVAAHCVHVGETDIAILAERDTMVAHCPKSNGKLGSGIAPIHEMKAAGVDIALGTDGAASNNRLDMFEEMRHACFLQRAKHEDSMLLAATDVLAMATENGRKAFGLSSGRLEVGAEADMVLVDAESVHLSPSHDGVSSLVYSAGESDITDVIVGGRFLMRNRELLTIDEEKVKAETERVLRR